MWELHYEIMKQFEPLTNCGSITLKNVISYTKNNVLIKEIVKFAFESP